MQSDLTFTYQPCQTCSAKIHCEQCGETIAEALRRMDGVEAAEVNARAFGADAQVILSDDGTPPEMDGSFDVFVGNPPYYSDYRIADIFLETAERALKTGGTCYTVVKNDAGLKPVQERWFPSVEVLHRRGYCVLKSIKKQYNHQQGEKTR